MNTLRAARCVLEPQVEAHAAAMFEVLSDPAIYEFEGVPPPSVEKLAEGFRRKESRRSPDGRSVAVLERTNHRSMGLLHHLGFAPGSAEDGRRYAAGDEDAVLLKAVAAVNVDRGER